VKNAIGLGVDLPKVTVAVFHQFFRMGTAIGKCCEARDTVSDAGSDVERSVDRIMHCYVADDFFQVAFCINVDDDSVLCHLPALRALSRLRKSESTSFAGR